MHSDTSKTVSQHGWRNPHDPVVQKKNPWDNYNPGPKGASKVHGGEAHNNAKTVSRMLKKGVK